MRSLFFKFHNVSMEVESDIEKILQMIKFQFRMHLISGNSTGKKLRITISPSGRAIKIPHGYKKLAFYNNVIIYRSPETKNFLITDGFSAARLNPRAGSAEILVGPIAINDPQTFSPLLFTVLVIELLRYKELYYLHSGAVSNGNKSILIVGEGDSGKTTLTTSFIKSGYSYLSDDAVFLSPAEGRRVIAHPLARDFQFMRDTASIFPEIAALAPKTYHGPKLPVQAEKVFNNKYIPFASPNILLFIRITKKPKTKISPVNYSEAIKHLILNSHQIMFDRSLAEKHLGILVNLLSQCLPFDAALGADILRKPENIKKHLEEALCHYRK